MLVPKFKALLLKHDRVFDVIIVQNTYDKNLLCKLANGEITKEMYKKQKSERLKGQWQWGTSSYNIRRSDVACKHNCIYCYITPMFERWGKECTKLNIEDLMPTDTQKVNKTWSKVLKNDREMIFFPSSSDIFIENVKDYISVCKKIIDANHEVFYVTKPTLKSMHEVVKELNLLGDHYKQKMVIFITITSNDNQILKEYEPYASSYEERINVVKYLKDNNLNVNIMMEPYLSDPIELSKTLITMLPQTGIIAIGQMNYSSNMHLTKNQLDYLRGLYSTENIKKLWTYVNVTDRVYLKKDSTNAVIKSLFPVKKI